MKVYAVLFVDGTHFIDETAWSVIKPMVNGVKGVAFKGFKTREDAARWVQTERGRQLTRKVIGGKQITKTEVMARNINTPYWKKNLGKSVAGRIELDQGFKRNMR